MKNTTGFMPALYPPDSPAWRLVEALVRRSKPGRPKGSPAQRPQRPCKASNFFDDMACQATKTLVAYVHSELQKQPLQVVQDASQLIRLRVLSALDYVIDQAHRRVWVEPSPLTARERRSKAIPPWGPMPRKPLYKVDLLNPLCKPAWLHYVATRPGWFTHAFAKHQPKQGQLFLQPRQGAEVMFEVAENAFALLHRSPKLAELRRDIAATLSAFLGIELLELGLRSRVFPHSNCLGADHLNRVWQHRSAFEQMERENPRLLSALAAWLDDGGLLLLSHQDDALPVIRKDLLASGLPPKAWRELAQHGLHKLLPARFSGVPWQTMCQTLWVLHHAHWPPTPPRRFLSLLLDAAGYPQSHSTRGERVPGWFWQIACQKAHRLRDDARAYARLVEQIPQHCVMLRAWQPEPDANQLRRGMAWVQSQTSTFLFLRNARQDPPWYPWLPHLAPSALLGHPVWVPLRSPRDLLTEAMALHNCADSYEDDCAAGTRLLISLRNPQTGKRLALAGMELKDKGWALTQVAGPCNRWVSTALHQQARQALKWVMAHSSSAIKVR